MFYCYAHNWTSPIEMCPICHPVETYTSSSTSFEYTPPQQGIYRIGGNEKYTYMLATNAPISLVYTEYGPEPAAYIQRFEIGKDAEE